MSAVRTGFDSRSWTDNNNDANSTTIRFAGCSNGGLGAPVTNTEIQLTHETAWYEPDENKGRKTLNCSSSATGNWGRMTSKGGYHFSVIKIQGATSGYYLSVPTINVAY
ncbi:hypothetical protein [Streptomyces sp. NPDC091212]|uniref:hypothetical protein n=1 Tax=Streptomyces sp. NPDC091212 TaxID=3155191 RepID=UPI00343A7202